MTDPVLFWNSVALEANRLSHTNGMGEQTGPTLSSRALAIVHLAIYDAYAGVINDPANLPRYISGPPSSAGASADAAVAAAAHSALSSLYPSQTSAFDTALSATGDPSNAGHGFGVAVAQAIISDRAADPDSGSSGYSPSVLRGKHRPDPDNSGQGFHAPHYGAQAKAFAVNQPHQLDPPPFDNPVYLKALREVRGQGIAQELMGTLPDNIVGVKPRTAEQTLIGIFWGYDGTANLGTPPRLFNQIVRHVALGKGNSVSDNARLFAFVNAAMADAGIFAWREKYRHDLWRPVVGIREHDPSMGPAPSQPASILSKDCDTAWLPLGAPNTNSLAKNFTPPFPAYPSGHATFGAAALHVTRLFYGVSTGDRKPDKLFKNLSLVSEEFDGVNRDNNGTVRPRHERSFPNGLWQMIEENGRSRVYLGVHWVFDAFATKGSGAPDLTKNVGGVPLGLAIAEDIFKFGNKKAPKKSIVGPSAPTSVAASRSKSRRTTTYSSRY